MHKSVWFKGVFLSWDKSQAPGSSLEFPKKKIQIFFPPNSGKEKDFHWKPKGIQGDRLKKGMLAIVFLC